jgi:hypothetical protein
MIPLALPVPSPITEGLLLRASSLDILPVLPSYALADDGLAVRVTVTGEGDILVGSASVDERSGWVDMYSTARATDSIAESIRVARAVGRACSAADWVAWIDVATDAGWLRGEDFLAQGALLELPPPCASIPVRNSEE